jgi:hypothetical protein
MRFVSCYAYILIITIWQLNWDIATAVVKFWFVSIIIQNRQWIILVVIPFISSLLLITPFNFSIWSTYSSPTISLDPITFMRIREWKKGTKKYVISVSLSSRVIVRFKLSYNPIILFTNSRILLFSYSPILVFSYSRILLFTYSPIRIFSYSHILIFSYSHILIWGNGSQIK